MTNPFKVEHRYQEKHLVLNGLYKQWEDGEKQTKHGLVVKELGRTLTVLELTDITELPKNEVDKLCLTLSMTGHISMYCKDQNGKNHRWIITDSGQQAIADNYYLNQRGLDNRTLYLQLGGLLLALVIGVLGLFFPRQDGGKIAPNSQTQLPPTVNTLSESDSASTNQLNPQ